MLKILKKLLVKLFIRLRQLFHSYHHDDTLWFLINEVERGLQISSQPTGAYLEPSSAYLIWNSAPERQRKLFHDDL